MKRFPLLCLSLGFLALTAPAHADMIFDYTGAAQTFTAVTAGQYEIFVSGAEGGLWGPRPQIGGEGGGAEIDGFFNLSLGESLTVYVGQTGSTGTTEAGGGGGGSFVVTSGGAPLMIAGGGGGAGQEGAANIADVGGQTGTSGASPAGSGAGASGNGGHGGVHDAGVDDSQGWNGGGGAGFYSNGTDGLAGNSGFGGNDFSTFSGGLSDSGAGEGGFGGGGGGGRFAGGGGGGYSGGAGGDGGSGGSGGGGGSYFDITGTLNYATGNANFGEGEVQFSLVSQQSATTPEPVSFALAGLGLLLVAGARRKQFAGNNRANGGYMLSACTAGRRSASRRFAAS